MGFIYKVINDVNDKVYIGKTVTTIANRWLHHKDDYLKYDWYFYKAMRKYGIEHFQILPIEECDDEILSERECYWINYYNSYHNGYNSTEGGEGRTQINRKKVKELWNDGLSSKQIAKKLGCWPSTIIDILKELEIYDMNEVAKRKQIDIGNAQSRKRIVQYDENGKIIAFYNSAAEAANIMNGKHNSIQTAIYNGTSRYGYFWGREGEKKPRFHPIKRPQIRKIYQFDLQKNFIKEYDNAAQAARENNIYSGSAILKVCNKERRKTGGYIWSYEKELK